MKIFNKLDKRLVLFSKNINGLDTIIGKKSINDDIKNVKYKKVLYPIDLTIPAYRNKGAFIYILDIEYGQLTFVQNDKLKIPHEIMDAILGNSIIGQLVSGLNKKTSVENVVLVIVVLLLGIAGGYIIGNIIPL